MKTVLFSNFPLPYNKMGSWTTRLTLFLEKNKKVFDFVICPKVEEPINNINYLFVNEINRKSLINRAKLKIGYQKYNYPNFIDQLKKIDSLKKIIVIIDNYKLLFDVHLYLKQTNQRKLNRICFFLHGYCYHLNQNDLLNFYNSLDHIIYLSKSSYAYDLNRLHSIEKNVSIIPNGIDSDVFYEPSVNEKNNLKKELGFREEIIFTWVANDRPKKGLFIIQEAWKKSKLYKNKNYKLLVIGTNISGEDNNIVYLGRMQKKLVSSYLKISDFFLFSTLCHEGYPLSLFEAVKCGLTCFASNISPVSEITKTIKTVCLVEMPHLISSWITIFDDISHNNFEHVNFETKDICNIETWESSVLNLINDEKQRLE